MTAQQKLICNLYDGIYNDVTHLPQGNLPIIMRIQYRLKMLGINYSMQTIRKSKPAKIRRLALKAMLDKLAQN